MSTLGDGGQAIANCPPLPHVTELRLERAVRRSCRRPAGAALTFRHEHGIGRSDGAERGEDENSGTDDLLHVYLLDIRQKCRVGSLPYLHRSVNRAESLTRSMRCGPGCGPLRWERVQREDPGCALQFRPSAS